LRYHHRFTVKAPLADVAEFHSQSASMAAITPPPIVVHVHTAPAKLGEGDHMDFTMWLGPLPVRWLAQIEQVTPTSFVDRQLRGPFASWAHKHTFEPVDAGKTAVIDEVNATLHANWFWKLVGASMWLGLPILFAYRGWKTRQVLESLRKRELQKATPG
jgi:ligand-binding SRPBCC domain-containing protein